MKSEYIDFSKYVATGYVEHKYNKAGQLTYPTNSQQYSYVDYDLYREAILIAEGSGWEQLCTTDNINSNSGQWLYTLFQHSDTDAVLAISYLPPDQLCEEARIKYGIDER